jgi:hypothetical protein
MLLCFSLMACITLPNCQSVQIPDVQFVGSLGPSGAVTFDLLDSTTNTMTLAQFASWWNDIGNANGPGVCMRTKDFAAIKADLETLCSWLNGGCTTAQQQAITNFMTNINSLQTKAKKP